ncbi:MAG: hypothetical protein V4550_14050 [Gemmatimonadota bacterium]
MPDNGIYATITYVAAAVVYTAYMITIRVRTKRLEERLRENEVRDGQG